MISRLFGNRADGDDSDYLHRAGKQSAARSAFKEATAQLNRALELVGKLPTGLDRDSRELPVRLALLGPLQATHFSTDEESRANLEAARALCGRIGDSAASWLALDAHGRLYVANYRGNSITVYPPNSVGAVQPV